MNKTKKRVRKIPKHASFRLTKRRFKHPSSLPSAITLLKDTYRLIRHNKKIFLGLAAVQALLVFVFVQGISLSSELRDARESVQDTLGSTNGIGESLGTGLALFGYLAATNSSSSGGAAGAYQLFLGLIISLAVIWAARQILADEVITLRDTLYKAMYPLIPFMLILIVIGIQLLPALIGNLLYSTVLTNGLAVTAIEKVLWLMLFLLFVTLSLYMLASSLFALYIVTLPDMTPMRALRSARQLVLHRRLNVLLRILVAPVVLLSLALILFVPLVLFAPIIAQPLFLLFSGLSLVFTHVYMYHLYRSLL